MGRRIPAPQAAIETRQPRASRDGKVRRPSAEGNSPMGSIDGRATHVFSTARGLTPAPMRKDRPAKVVRVQKLRMPWIGPRLDRRGSSTVSPGGGRHLGGASRRSRGVVDSRRLHHPCLVFGYQGDRRVAESRNRRRNSPAVRLLGREEGRRHRWKDRPEAVA